MPNEESSPTSEWLALSNLDEAVIALQSVVSLSRVLGGTNDAWHHSATYEDAMCAFTTYLEDCVDRVADCKEALFKQYRERKGLPEPNAASGWWSPAAALARAEKNSAVPKKKPVTKKGKSSGK